MKFVIVGTGGFARELAGLISGDAGHVEGFYGPGPEKIDPESWLGGDNKLSIDCEADVLVAVGDPSLRYKLSVSLHDLGLSFGRFVHSSAYVDSSVPIGWGAMVYPNVVAHIGCTIGEGALLNSNCSIGHDTSIGSFSNIQPGASIAGFCQLGKRVTVGIGVSIRENIRVCDDITIGAGAAVVCDLNTPGTYVGTPARLLERQ